MKETVSDDVIYFAMVLEEKTHATFLIHSFYFLSASIHITFLFYLNYEEKIYLLFPAIILNKECSVL